MPSIIGQCMHSTDQDRRNLFTLPGQLDRVTTERNNDPPIQATNTPASPVMLWRRPAPLQVFLQRATTTPEFMHIAVSRLLLIRVGIGTDQLLGHGRSSISLDFPGFIKESIGNNLPRQKGVGQLSQVDNRPVR